MSNSAASHRATQRSLSSDSAPDVSPPRIVYASFDRFPAPKGAATHIEAFVSALGQRFGDVALLTVPSEAAELARRAEAHRDRGNVALAPTPADSPATPATWHTQGVRHYPLNASGAQLFDRVLRYRSQMWHWWQRSFTAEKTQLPLFHCRSIFEGYLVARAKERLCSKFVFEVNGLPSIELKYRYPRVADDVELQRKLRHQEDVCLQAADLILTVSQVNADHIVDRGVPETKIRVIPNGVDFDLCSYHPPDPSQPKRWEAGESMHMLYAGTMASWQGVPHVLEALALLRRDHPATLTLVGTSRPHQRRDLLQLAWKLGVSEHVQLLDPVPRSELVRLHHDADVVVAPLTRNDRNLVQGCCPLKVLEAMACGTPLIASDLPVVRELVSDKEAILVRPGSGKAIKDGMLRLRLEDDLGVRLSRTARDRVERDFSWSRAQASLIEAYESLGVGHG